MSDLIYDKIPVTASPWTSSRGSSGEGIGSHDSVIGIPGRQTESIVQDGSLRTLYPSEYNSWKAMRGRCLSPKSPSYRYYGARGVRICDQWLHSFATFLADLGPKPGPGYSIERKDAAGNYEPGNCLWATAKVQARNRPQYNRPLKAGGATHCVGEWSELTGIDRGTIASRIRLGWTAEEAVGIVPRSERRGRRAINADS